MIGREAFIVCLREYFDYLRLWGERSGVAKRISQFGGVKQGESVEGGTATGIKIR